ncbi:uncharacterized protein LOC143033908 [Oratosquilla oratoria]|uniref:uncharacterized protein LOC143033908 n=1 Tax=Oratosquilla oratoria TaxID=337810 RepID=UPI003F765B06
MHTKSLKPLQLGSSVPLLFLILAVTRGYQMTPNQEADVIIDQGSHTTLQVNKPGLLYCYAQAQESYPLYNLHVSWIDSKGQEVPILKSTSTDLPALYTVGEEYRIPHSYLVFSHFDKTLIGTYECLLKCDGIQIANQTIKVDSE